MQRNILLLILVIVVSFVLAPYLGGWYDRIDYQNSGWITSKEDAVNFAGFILSYILLIPFVFKLFGKNNQNKWIAGLSAPVFLFYAGYNYKLLYIPIALALIGFALAKLLNLLISKFKHPNPPMVIR